MIPFQNILTDKHRITLEAIDEDCVDTLISFWSLYNKRQNNVYRIKTILSTLSLPRQKERLDTLIRYVESKSERFQRQSEIPILVDYLTSEEIDDMLFMTWEKTSQKKNSIDLRKRIFEIL